MPTKYLFAASTGGHLAQLHRLAEHLDGSEDSLWVTFRSPQSESLLHDRRVMYIPYIRPRDARGVARGMASIGRLLRQERFDRVMSTGAGIALAVFPLTRLRRIPNDYVESVSRVQGPSLTGRIVAASSLASTWTQHASWASKRWKLRSSVLAGFRSVPKQAPPADRAPLRVFCTLGTIEGYRFDSLIDRLIDVSGPGAHLVWQLGYSARDGLPGTTHSLMSNAAFEDAALTADVVVTHSGVGTILKLLDLGIRPVVVPRRSARNEHVDDHQEQIAALVEREGLAVVRESDELKQDDLRLASRLAVEPLIGRHDDAR
ncbi:glycosyltransferase [Agromyces silvae]|uniref:glycosyltransferase n=1 Tax=Agromyces silvae TaxID=3388266 RepID=UPI00280AAB4A|nr:glycosyltransferase [Agromyces protaetiae]